MADDTFEAVSVCARRFLSGAVLQAAGVTAGNGSVIDWRVVKSGDVVRSGADAFDTARCFVLLVGVDVALAAADPTVTTPAPLPGPKITAFAMDPRGCRCRQFTVGSFRVRVDILSWLYDQDDAVAAEFTTALATFAASVTSEPE